MKDLCVSTYYFRRAIPIAESVADGTSGVLLDGLKEVLGITKEAGLQGLEMLVSLTPEVMALLKEYGLKVAVGYFGVGEDGTIRDAAAYHELGVKYIQSTGLPTFTDYERTMRAVEMANRQAKIAKAEGFKVYVHCHPQDFKWNDKDGEYCYETFIRHMDPEGCVLQLDAGWAGTAGVDVWWLLQKYGHLVKSLHIKPYCGMLGVTAVDPLFEGSDGPTPAFLSGNLTPEQMRKIQERMAVLQKIQGPLSESVRSYEEIMTLAEEKGCETFILERDFFGGATKEDVVRTLHEDVEYIRTYW